MANLEIGAGATESLAERVCGLVQGLETPGLFQGLQVQIDLTNSQGRWELLVLGVLLAARVSEAVAETTCEALRQNGLLDLGRMLQMREQDMHRLGEVLGAEYRGIVDRGKKGMALYENAQRLHDVYGGDLNRLYEQSYASREVVQALQEFRQIHTRARWVCRCMHEAGLWTSLSRSEMLYCDAHVRRALVRLGLVDGTKAWAVVKEEIQGVVDRVFDGDTTCLYRLGRYKCLSSEACNPRCSLVDLCSYMQSGR
jgi:endonuclease III